MARSSVLTAVLLVSACAGSAPSVGPRSGGPLVADLFPMEDRTAAFVRSRGEDVTVQVSAAAGQAVLRIAGAGPERRIDVRRDGESLVFSGGPESGTELIRLGAVPGDSWTSGAATVHFDGWERIEVPGGTFDAARVRTVEGAPTLAVVQTWWFAPGTGLVRLRSDRGGVFADEMSLAR